MSPETATAEAAITWISGPVLRARTRGAFHVHEATLVGHRRLLGEVIRVAGDEVVVQVYEDTTGLRPGDTLTATGSPLSVRLGPGLLGHIFDGLLRPLAGQGTYVQPGSGVRQTGQSFNFKPTAVVGEQLAGGAVFGTVSRSDARPQRCLVPPAVRGKVVRIAAPGNYPGHLPVCVLRDAQGGTHEIAMSHRWPIRQPRPVAARTAVEGPLFTGQRVLDSIFPLACGGRAAMPGGFGTGKTVLQETLAKWCDADIIIYVGCGERGNEMAGVLHEFPALEDPRTGRPLMERTIIIANTSNMPVSAREASIYTAVTVGEYFRDQGMRVALMADSTSRWAEALREVSGRLGELPGEAGYPAYLSSRLADFYERAAHVRTLSGEVGSLSIIGAVSPPSADFSEPVTTHTRRYVRCLWALDAGRAQARFYPAVHPLQSYSQDIQLLSHFWNQHGNPDWLEQRRQFLGLLEEQSHLERMARIVGRDALPPRQQHVLLCAELINGAFLHQSAFSAADRFCTPAKQVAMTKLISHFINQTDKAVARGVSVEAINAMPVVRRLRRMGEEIDDDTLDKFDALRQELEVECTRLTRQAAHDAD